MKSKIIYNPALTKEQLAFVKDNRSLNTPYEYGAFLIEYRRDEDIDRVIVVEPSFLAAEKRAKYSGFVEVGYAFEVKRIMANTGFLMADLISARDRYWEAGRNYVESSEMYKRLAIKVNRIRHILRQRYDYPKIN